VLISIALRLASAVRHIVVSSAARRELSLDGE
jgi:hypothetical protein